MSTVLAIYAAMSLVAAVAMLGDKRAARLGRPRTRESTLHLLELLGGWPGSLLAQRLVRHKTSKLSYQAWFWAIVVLHGAVGSWQLIRQ